MGLFSDPALKLKYNKSKFRLKQWESEFRKESGCDPSKDDIKGAPPQIRDAYKWYWRLKIHSLGQDCLIDDLFCDIQSDGMQTTYPLNASGNPTTSASDTLPINNKSPDKISDAADSMVNGLDASKFLASQESTHINSDKVVTSNGASEFLASQESKHINSDKVTSNGESSARNFESDLEIDFGELHGKEKVSPDQCSQNSIKETSAVESLQNEEGKSISEASFQVWGAHLNKPQNKKWTGNKPILPRSSSFQLAEKLFHGSKFKKRNPRKSLSFASSKTKSFNSVSSFENQSQQSEPSSIHEESQDGFPVSTLEAESSGNDKPKYSASDFVIMKRNIAVSAQPISAVQKLVGKDFKTERKPERKLDKGWIERTTVTPIMPGSDSNLIRVENLTNPAYFNDSSPTSDDDDDDIIYDSDTECTETKHIRRLALLRNENGKVMSRGISDQVDNSCASIEKTELNVNLKKRNLDAIETAMVVLSSQEKLEKIDGPISKKPKISSKSETILETDDGLENEPSQKNISKITKSSRECKSKMTKAELLDKRVASGTINDNFVRINLKKKVFVRGKKTMNFQKYKKQQWKKRKNEVARDEEKAAFISRMDPSDGAAGGGLQKCFKCGDVGHFARACLKLRGDKLLPNDVSEDDESPFPSLAEVEKMAQEKIPLRTTHRAVVKQFSNLEQPQMLPMGSTPPVGKELSEYQELCDINSLKDIESMPDEAEMRQFKEPDSISKITFGTVKPLYSLNQDGSVRSTPPEVYECLQMFGHKKFRPGQEEAVMRVLSGLSTLVTLSTGSGKSLCYQLPAYLYACRSKCITLVVSPLVSLMDDQVTDLPPFVQAAALHTGQTEKQREKVMDLVKSGKLQFLLVSPEAVVAGEKRTGFGRILREIPDIAFACIDEVHCVSQWSHNFRPSYLMLCKVLREKLGVRTVIGLTATATQTTIQSIVEHLNIPDGRRGVIQDIPLPNNLVLTVSRDSDRDRALLRLLNTNAFSNFESIIVYCTRREECERVSALLRTCLKDLKTNMSSNKKISSIAEAYHAGLSATRRKQVQAAFMTGKLRIVAATVAFGMGINKSDIRAVIHYNMPKSFESYVQEVGRAGRDGETSHCHLFLTSNGWDLRELRRHIFADSVDRHTIRKLLQRVFVTCKCNKAPSTGENRSSTSDQVESILAGSDAEMKLSFAEDNRTNTYPVCVGHEVSFSVEHTVEALDLPEENITTLLCYLELHDQQYIKVLPSAYVMCKIQSYRGKRHIRDVARTCPPLAMAVAMDLKNNSKEQESNTLEFHVMEIANAIQWDSGIVKHELMKLEWTEANGKTRRSGIRVELSNLGFRVKAPGNLSSEELDAALDFLFKRVNDQEKSSLYQLQLIFNALTSSSYSSVQSMLDSSDWEQHSEALKSSVRSYFQMEFLSFDDIEQEVKLENGEQIASDIRQLVNIYRDNSFTGRALARIFHGISSPNFPAQVWGRCRFWRAHLDSDFKLICHLATRVLLQMR